MQDEDRYPRAAAEAVRSFLMLRLDRHLGLRQKNLRQLPPAHAGISRHRGPPRGYEAWRNPLSDRDRGWEVLGCWSRRTPSKTQLLVLRLKTLPTRSCRIFSTSTTSSTPTSNGLAVCCWPAHEDPDTLFVKTVKANSGDAAYNRTTFYEAWRLTIQRYGIYNPYTGRGEIKGLLPHGPHNVRDVLATHILQQTGSYEQASYAIQDTAEMVASHYGRFLPQGKAALAVKILNQVGETA